MPGPCVASRLVDCDAPLRLRTLPFGELSDTARDDEALITDDRELLLLARPIETGLPESALGRFDDAEEIEEELPFGKFISAEIGRQ